MLDSTSGVTSPDGASKEPAPRGGQRPGGTWWSRQFKLSVLECFSPLAKGLAYSRAGQVGELEVVPGSVYARVQGSRSNPYMVEVSLPVFNEEQWAVLEAELAVRLGPLGPLEADGAGGTLPEDLAPLLAEASLQLFPDGGQELSGQCNCVELPKPCRHIAATYLTLAEAFDRDPLLLCQWRGRDRGQLLERVTRLRAALVPPAPPVPYHAPAAEQPAAWAEEPAAECGPARRSRTYDPSTRPGSAEQRAFYLEVREHCRLDVAEINRNILEEWRLINEEAQRVQALIQDLEGRKLVAAQMYSAASELLGEADDLDVSPAIQEA